MPPTHFRQMLRTFAELPDCSGPAGPQGSEGGGSEVQLPSVYQPPYALTLLQA